MDESSGSSVAAAKLDWGDESGAGKVPMWFVGQHRSSCRFCVTVWFVGQPMRFFGSVAVRWSGV